MATPVGRTLFKKKDGILTLTSDQETVTWTPNSGGPAAVSMLVANITNLQQTPDSSPKVMLKIFEKQAPDAEPVTYLFHFNTSEAKNEAKAVRDLLSRILADTRSKDPSLPQPRQGTPSGQDSQVNGNGSGTSGSMAFASAATSQPAAVRWFDDNYLKNDIELQQSLMKKDRSLHQTYMEALSAKPESISGASFNSQFWSTRTNHLRSHAIESNQKKGAYNVLSTVKPRTVDGELKLNISVEQVQMIFAQHPLVKRIYNENVPKVSEAQFWSRFFLSKLSKKLRGERVTNSDAPDALFDKYDASENLQGVQSKIMAQSVIPHIIDLEGNEENQGGMRSGNAKDVEMRPRANFPIVKTLNSLSEKIMANVAPSDIYAVDDESRNTYNELALRDLRGDAEEVRIMLNIKEQNKFFSKQDSAPSKQASVFSKQDPSDVLLDVQGDLETLQGDGAGGIDLHAGVGFEEESDSDDEEGKKSKKHSQVGSRWALKGAEEEILAGIRQQRSQRYGDSSDASTPMGLPQAIATKAALTHATTLEFLHQFWTAFLSGDPDRAAELQYLSESLKRSEDRISAVAEEANVAREEVIKKRKVEIRDHFERTGKKIRWKPDMVRGGRDAVNRLMGPVKEALQKAEGDYARALAAEGIQVSTE